MTRIKEIKEIKIDDLVVGKGQVRLTNVAKEISDLADSIRKVGLLQPIVVCPAKTEGKYEIILGQRRVLAYKELQREKILAAILDEKVSEQYAKALSLSENIIRTPLSTRDKIDACNYLYKRYLDIDILVEELGLPRAEIERYINYPRLKPELKKLHDEEGVDLKVVLRAQDAASVEGEYNAEEAVKFAREMAGMNDAQRKQVIKTKKDDSSLSAEEAVEKVRTRTKQVEIKTLIGPEAARALGMFAKDEKTNRGDAAATLIDDGLRDKGYLAGEENEGS